MMRDMVTFRRTIGKRPERHYVPIGEQAENLCALAGSSQLRPEQIAIVEKMGFVVRVIATQPDGTEEDFA